ncbi:MAG: winged helix-turn-helix transcriptional regulator [Candidatus Methanofastidiosia archaeon]
MCDNGKLENKHCRGECLCPITDLLNLISKKWTVCIISLLGNRKMRFNEIKREIEKISPKTLSERLKELESKSIVKKEITLQVPVKSEYSLTDKGKDIRNALSPLLESVEKWHQL